MRSRRLELGAFLAGALALGALAFGCSGGGAGAALFQENAIEETDAAPPSGDDAQADDVPGTEEDGGLETGPVMVDDGGNTAEDAGSEGDATIDERTDDASDAASDAAKEGAADARIDGKKGCGGTGVGPHCWYLGASGATCTTTCKKHGGYDFQATASYVGGAGTADNCATVFQALTGRVVAPVCMVPPAAPLLCRMFDQQSCVYQASFAPNVSALWVNGSQAPTADAAYPGMERVCACRQ